MRKVKITEGEIYHICNKSISNFGIFKNSSSVVRFLQTLTYYNKTTHPKRISEQRLKKYKSEDILLSSDSSIAKFICYCIMPDHYHLIVKVLSNNFSKYISDVQNSYTRYFNVKIGRKGPLWQSRYRIAHIKTSEQLLHTTRYVHLNPTSSNLVAKPEDWKFSSYRDFINNQDILRSITELTISSPINYRKFVEDRIDYQRKLKKIKNLLLE